MPDISMCAAQDCPTADICYRKTATPSGYRQAYSEFKYNEDGSCDYFMEIWNNREAIKGEVGKEFGKVL